MITWAYTIGNGCSHLVGFNKHMKKISEILEQKNNWKMSIGNKEFNIKGNGCADPIEYMERIVSPVANRHLIEVDSWVIMYNFEDGETWEVYKE